MPKTWGELKTETLKKMFTYSNNGIPVPSGNEDYLLSMPEAANFAFRDLAATCRPIVRRYGISHAPVKNMLGEAPSRFDMVQSAGADIEYMAESPKAYYFEVDAPCSIVLEKITGSGAIPIRAMTNVKKDVFTPFSGLITEPGTIRLRFAGGSLYNIRNVAFYNAPFADVADVPPFMSCGRYNLKALIGPSFMRLPPNAVTVTGGGWYRRDDEYMWEDDCTLVIDRYAVGQYDVLYEAYPTPITASTPDGFALELPDEVLDIAPLYMAGQLFMEDNPSYATNLLNQYANRRAELSDDRMPLGRSAWHNETGWW